ncbi:hypothetical protein AB0C34_00260 [Nocardia sp. NPDC049220]|uniref:SMP-30/gluconolactonase/LRE family protein n=1 Tax=Nocardia sp. NPDC049220 TaxID=3155273 RepID=UPI0033CEB59F
MRTSRRRAAVMLSAAVFTLPGVFAPSGAADPAARAMASCAPASVTTALPAGLPLLDWSENLGYDAQGNLWVSRLYRNEVQRYDAAGTLTASVPIEFPGAVRLGPDGLLYVVYGDTPSSAVRPGGVVRFDPASSAPEPAVFVSGFVMPNGAAFDSSGDLYVATLSGVVRVHADATIDTGWGRSAAGVAANGIAVHGEDLYVTSNGGPLGRVVRIPLAAPTDRVTVVDLASPLAGVPDFADDLLADPAGVLFVTTLAGQLIRVDPATGSVCVVLSGQPMTSVVAVPDHPEEVLAGTEGGDIVRIRLSG